LELRELRYFLALAEERNFTRAAARVYVTQPAFSRAIRKLEREIGGELFDRSTRQVHLTHRGVGLLPDARSLIALADAAVAALRSGGERADAGPAPVHPASRAS